MRTDFHSSETQDRAKKYLHDLLAAIEIEGSISQRVLYSTFFLRVGKERLFVARAFERIKKTGPYETEPTGQVSIVAGYKDIKKTFTESAATKKFTPKKWAQIVEWTKVYAETELGKKQKEIERHRERRAIVERLEEFFPSLGLRSYALPGARSMRATTSNWNTDEICAKITITIPADAIEPVAKALLVALAPFAEEEEKDD